MGDDPPDEIVRVQPAGGNVFGGAVERFAGERPVAEGEQQPLGDAFEQAAAPIRFRSAGPRRRLQQRRGEVGYAVSRCGGRAHDRRLRPLRGQQRQHGAELLLQPFRAGPVGLVDGKHVGDFHDARLGRLDIVALIGRQHDADRVGKLRDIDLGLPRADRLDDDDFAAEGFKYGDRIADRRRQAAQRAAGRHGTDEYPRVFMVRLHAHAVTEHGAAAEGTGRIDRQHGYGEARLAQMPRHAVDQRALADSRRSGDADPPRPGGAGEQLGEQVVGPRPAVFDLAERPRQRAGGTRPHLPRDPLDLPVHPLFPQLARRRPRTHDCSRAAPAAGARGARAKIGTRPMRLLLPICAMVLAGLPLMPACGGKGPYDADPTEPAEAAAKLVLLDGFRAELFAAEPHVVDPVEICFDEAGGIYVAEMLDYPFDPAEGEPPRSRIRFLEDADGDGAIDKATVFADRLLQVTGVLPWKGGVFATAAPDVLYLKDTDGDRIADVREVFFTGFQSREVSSESRVTNLRYGIDNWIYAANNGRPGEIRSPRFPGKPSVSVRGYDFRFNPVTGDFAPAAGPTQFGMSFDDWGNRFVSQNTVHLRHAVLPARYILRNPAYEPGSMLHYTPGDDPRNSRIFPLTQPQQWRIERTAARQKRYDAERPGRKELVGGHFTAATGATVYTGDAFGEDYRGSVFIADANAGIVRREVLIDAGPTFRSEPRPADREFLAAREIWFRPVNLANAPDGNLYVLDFYREYIEEPASIPQAVKERLQLDFYRGNDRGRIYRIVRDEPPARRGLDAGLRSAPVAALVGALEHENGWHRLTAQRLLVERGDRDAAEALRTLLRGGASPRARLHALWTLHGLGALGIGDVRAALGDAHSALRAHAVRLSEEFLPEFAGEVAALRSDPDGKVRFQVALTIGEVEGSAEAVSAMAAAHAGDRWFRQALLTSLRGNGADVLELLAARHRAFFSDSAAGTPFVEGLAAQVGRGQDPEKIARAAAILAASPYFRQTRWLTAGLRGLARGLAVEGKRAALEFDNADRAFRRWLSYGDENVRGAAADLAQYFHLPRRIETSLAAAGDPDLAAVWRIAAIRLLRGADFEAAAPVLARILTSPESPELHREAVAALAVFDSPRVADIVIAGWPGYGPLAREAALRALLARRERAAQLIAAVESGAIAPGAIDPIHRIRLREYPDEETRRRAGAVFAASAGGRAAVVGRFAGVLRLRGDAARGSEVFDLHCAQCHTPRGSRGRIGPDLAGVNNKTREELLTHILDPSFEIQPNYTNYIVIDRGGRIYDGLLAGESAAAVTLRGERGNVTILRAQIAEMRASAVSLMPEGFENDLSRRGLADVIAYLRAGL